MMVNIFLISSFFNMNEAQRLCLRSGGLLKPRPVHVGKRNIKTKLHTLMSRHHCANILLAAGVSTPNYIY